MTYKGKVQGGVVVFEGNVRPPEGTSVSVQAMASENRSTVEDLAAMADLAVQTNVRDLSTNIDHYLYGHPKADNGR